MMARIDGDELLRIPDNFAEKALTLGIKSKIKLFVMSRSSKFTQLPPGEIQLISNKFPNSALVIVKRAPKVNGEYVTDHPDLQTLTYRDLWLFSSELYLLEEFEKPSTGEALENNASWTQLRTKAIHALEKFATWRKLNPKIKIKITDNLKDWIKKEVTTKEYEIQIITQVLKNHFKF